jgi:hypothetical protein
MVTTPLRKLSDPMKVRSKDKTAIINDMWWRGDSGLTRNETTRAGIVSPIHGCQRNKRKFSGEVNARAGKLLTSFVENIALRQGIGLARPESSEMRGRGEFYRAGRFYCGLPLG